MPYLLRPHRPGDMGWVVHRHGALYAREYGWDERFEALVATIVAKFVEHFDPKRERCWIAEREGEIVGSVFLVSKSATVAQLRLLLRRAGGARARASAAGWSTSASASPASTGYRKIVLWTNSILHAARHIYETAGYRLVDEEPHHSFGHRPGRADLGAEAVAGSPPAPSGFFASRQCRRPALARIRRTPRRPDIAYDLGPRQIAVQSHQ